jgi:predicted nucleotidyltransferase
MQRGDYYDYRRGAESMQQFVPYNLEDDPVIHALCAEGAADPNVIGILVTGSRAAGAVTVESDYDVIFVVTDETRERYSREHREPQRGHTVEPPIDTTDVCWHESPRSLRECNTFGVDACRVVYDRTGELAALARELEYMPEQEANAIVRQAYDDYLDAIWRTQKCWRQGDALGTRLEIGRLVNALLRMLFGLERLWQPFGNRVFLHFHKRDGQGWQPGELHASLLELLTTGDIRRHERVARRTIALMDERGFGDEYAGWKEQIDRVLAWAAEKA